VADRGLAVYAAAYPAARPYLGAWAASLRAQTDRDFDVWVTADGLDPEALKRTLDLDRAHVVETPAGATQTPGQLRALAMEQLVDRYDAVVFVDVDDVLEPSRVAAARQALGQWDVTGCRLRIMDESGGDLGVVFGPIEGEDPCAYLPRWNVFGLSNTAYRTSALRECLPIPADCILVDWLLASRAWVRGKRIGFDLEPRMRYRQYARNTAHVLGPSTAAGVRRATELVTAYYRQLLAPAPVGDPSRLAELHRAKASIERFERWSASSEEGMRTYVERLNAMQRRYLWWWSVAHPDLEELWRA
jgi:hypothetical protein